MIISEKLRRAIHFSLFSLVRIASHPRCWDLNNHNVNNLFLRAFRKQDSIEVPLIISSSIIEYGLPFNTIVPMSTEGRYCPYKTVDSIVSCFIESVIYTDSELHKLESEKYGTYYGGRGVILDKHLNVLLMPVLEVDNNGEILKYKLYVNPKVTLMTGSVEKHIYTKIIPEVLNYSFSVFNGTSTIEVKPDVVFKDVTDMFTATPNAPSENYNEEIKELLLNNIDNIVNTCNNVNR